MQFPFILRLFLVLASLLMLGYLTKEGQLILAPLFTGFLLTMISLPLASFLERKIMLSRGISTLICVLLIISVLTALGQFFISKFADLANDAPVLEKQLLTTFHDLQDWVHKKFNINIKEQLDYLNSFLEKILSSGTIILGATLTMFTSTLAFFFFTLLFYIFILNYRAVFYGFLISAFSSKHLPKVGAVFFEVQSIIKQYITGLVLQIIIVSTLTTLLLSILGVKYAVLLGLMTGLLNVIPYVGIIISGLISTMIAFTLGSGNMSLFTIIGYVVIHAIDANVVLPFVVGSKVKINPLFSFIGLLVGEKLWGISGMLLCIPALAILKVILDRIPETAAWGILLGEDNPISTTHISEIRDPDALQQKSNRFFELKKKFRFPGKKG